MFDTSDGLLRLGYGAATAAYTLYALWLWRLGLLRANRGPSSRWYLGAVLASAAWAASAWIDLDSSKRVTWHLALLLDNARYAAWLAFLLSLLPAHGRVSGTDRAASRRGWGWWLLGLLVLGGLALNAWLATHDEGAVDISRATASLLLAWAVAGLLLVEQVFRNQSEQSTWSAKPLCLGLAGLFVYDLYLYSQSMLFGRLDLDVADARGLAHALMVGLLVVASRRHARWLTKIEISQAAAFYSASLLMIGGYLLVMAGAGYYVRVVGGSWGGALQAALLFAALVLLGVVLASASMRARLRVFLGKHFFRYRYDYRNEWLRFTAKLSSSDDPQQVGTTVVRGLADMVEAQGGGLWLKVIGEDRCVLAAAWNLPAVDGREPLDSPFCTLMREREWLFNLAADRHAPTERDALAVLPDWLRALPQAWVVVPLIVADELNGFVVLTRPRAPVELNWEVRDLLKTAARQAAAFLAQMHATEALLEARKFEAFNRMSAFVVHDLKNIVTQLALMLKNAERHRDNPEFQADMLETVQNSVEKMRQLMLQLREGQRPTGTQAGVDLAAIAQRLQTTAQQRGRELVLDLADRVATRGQPERVERVIGHVVQNALEATPASGKVWLRLSQSAGRAVVEVGDTGAGMSPEFIQNRLFRPFNTTKTSGMGIGTFESFQYVKELGGQIDVKSELGVGTLVTMLLPLFDLRTGSDLHVPTSPAKL
ncbi:XrtA/PEP-CTERM system histidine kinase PrsK [Ideonella sp. DXS22W]|uniref:histidine kinase n=1 Tax=Pseudaquabacterium inlustre TaxID=2984192 RepID=A0ABU9CND2_9BURK